MYDWFSENNTAYIITEFVNGITLDKRVIQKGRYSWNELYQKLLPLINSLSILHKKGIIHRDIKPQNIMIKNIENVGEEFILIDFGLARSTETRTLSSVGLSFSPGYSPIEQRTFTMPDGEYTDVYALAATIYFALTGESPCSDMTHTIEGNFPQIYNLVKCYGVPQNVADALIYALELDYRKRCGSLRVLMQMFKPESYDNFNQTAVNEDRTVYAVTDSPIPPQNTVNNTGGENKAVSEINIAAPEQNSLSNQMHTNGEKASAASKANTEENRTINVKSESAAAADISGNDLSAESSKSAAKPQITKANKEHDLNTDSSPRKSKPNSDKQNVKEDLHYPDDDSGSENAALKTERDRKLKYILISSFLVLTLIIGAVVLANPDSESSDVDNSELSSSSSVDNSDFSSNDSSSPTVSEILQHRENAVKKAIMQRGSFRKAHCILTAADIWTIITIRTVILKIITMCRIMIITPM